MKNIQQLFEDIVSSNPNNVAVVCDGTQITYAQLNDKANQLANYLINTCQIQSEDLIALHLDKSEQVIITILAILKSGAAYVPIDPNYPDERIAYMLFDTKAKIIITNEKYRNQLSTIRSINDETFAMVLAVDNKVISEQLKKQDKNNLISNTNGNSLSSIMYTSRDTRKPKGVMVMHKNITSLVLNQSYMDIKENDTFLMLSNIAFDASTFEIWAPILNGGKLISPSNTFELIANITLFKNILLEYKISCLWLTKTLFDQLFLMDNTVFYKLQYLIVGGEIQDFSLIKQLSQSEYAPQNLINGYGPTENTTISCIFKIDKSNLLNLESVQIGKPINKRTAYLLDDNLNRSPIGAIGELYLGGLGLTRGYLNLPQLSKEKFISNPISLEGEDQNLDPKLYKTGDLARYLPDGNIEYMGRNDLPKLIFMFSGQGSQYYDMAIDLYCNDQLFKSIVDNVIKIANKYLDHNLHEVLFPSLKSETTLQLVDIYQSKWAPITLFTISYSLATYLETIGIEVTAYIGHSIGEYVAATISGVFELEDAISLVITCGKLMQMMDGGGMLAINCSYDSMINTVKDFNLEVSSINSPQNITVSGKNKDIMALIKLLKNSDIKVFKLHTSHAYHSKIMEDAAAKFEQEFVNLKLKPPNGKFISCLSGNWASNEVTSPLYWCNQLRNKVEFSKGIQTIVNTYGENALFIEVGVGKALSRFVGQHTYKDGHQLHSVQLLPSFKDDALKKMIINSREAILSTLWKNGVKSSFSTYVKNTISEIVTDLPNYQFDFKSCWINNAQSKIS